MKILFVSGTCSKKKYNEIFLDRKVKMVDPSQKFFHLILEGLTNLKEVTMIDMISIPPVSASSHSKYIWKKQREVENKKLQYLYVGFLNGKIMRYITTMFNSFLGILKWQIANRKDEKKIIICDPTLLFQTVPLKILRIFFNTKIVGFITDLPMLGTIIEHKKMSKTRSAIQKVYDVLATSMCNHLDGYILLTEQMNHKVNIKNKPYIIIEGSVDCEMLMKKNSISKKEKPPIIMYAGGLHEKFGVIKLVEAVHLSELENMELHLYGTGQAVDYIRRMEHMDSRIKYKGVVSTDEIVELEMKASLLVNPRPTNEEFTKYSFPSKTLEYMVSGTPLLTTRLAGIPQEYFNFVYTIDQEDEQSLASYVSAIIKKSPEELFAFGSSGKQFVLKNKNNRIQAEKILSYLSKLL